MTILALGTMAPAKIRWLLQMMILVRRMIVLPLATLARRTTILALGTTAPAKGDGFRKTAILV